ncbi:MAG: hypothetical protein Q7R81_02910 [Candidatus Peregrinibacteria bacterium]|nr:hypothetical protein [Candidatus Peregrinibacteria bacterium]
MDMSTTTLPFTANSEIFHAFQRLWQEELGEELSYEYAEANPKLLALVGSVARWKRSQQSQIL